VIEPEVGDGASGGVGRPVNSGAPFGGASISGMGNL